MRAADRWKQRSQTWSLALLILSLVFSPLLFDLSRLFLAR
jgi:hypothetical protein